ncbi:TonB-dependent receptor domain-containing protein [Alkalimarinus alittae]|uniref:TonB-dependent receptor n=1 Tax=Alkalimarinus alittae TaxID=2961619 RepID=A0ABY6N4X9_9ALTE|nr:TonB-dependent receptor [Alkalimarinus alittae]UZE97065.1 TonB-dependent receptor [Alkalimarinus alittae]
MPQLSHFTHKHRLSLLAVSIAGAISTQAMAQEADTTQAIAHETTEDVRNTDMIVIKGQATGGIDNLITSEDLEKTTASSLGEIFQLDPQVNAGGAVGLGQKLYLRNIGENELNISVDGAEQAGAAFHHAGRIAIDPELLKQVEIEAGAGSAAAGFGALGGSIRFVTKDPGDLLNAGEQAGGLVKGTYYSNGEGYRVSTTVFARDESDTVSVLASVIGSDSDYLEDGNGDDILGTNSENLNGYVKLVANLTEEQKLSVSYERLKEEGDLPFRPEWIVTPGTSYETPTEVTRDTAILNYEFDSVSNDFVDVMFNVYNTNNEQQRTSTGRFSNIDVETVESYGLTLQNTSLVASHELIYGINYRDDESSYAGLLDGTYNGKETGEVRGIYLQDVITLTNELTLSAGARYDEYEVDEEAAAKNLEDSAVSPNISANYDITSDFSISAGYAQAFRGPTVRDGSLVYGANGNVRDPDLKGETSKNYELGFDYGYQNFGLSGGVYSLTIEDAVLTKGYTNADDDIETTGFYIKADYAWNNLTAALSFISADTEIDSQDAFRYITGSTATSMGNKVVTDISYDINNDLLVGWVAEFVQGIDISVNDAWNDPSYPISDFSKAGYGVHDIYARWLPTSSEDITLTLTVKNIFDKQYLDHASSEDLSGSPGYESIAGQPEPGRDIRLTAAWRI